MDRAENYREHAAECLALAKTIGDPHWRAQLMAIAAQWLELADQKSERTRPEHEPRQRSASKTHVL
jgi:hypothetical protein